MFEDTEKLVYDVSKWDRIQWENFLEGNPTNQSGLEIGANKVPSFPIFAQEVFHRLYAPDEKPLDKTLPEAQWAVQAHTEITENTEFGDLRTLIEVEAASDPFKKLFLAGTGAAKFSEAVGLRLPKPRTSMPNPQELRQQHKAIKQQLHQLQQQVNKAETTETSEKLQQQIGDLQQQLKAIASEEQIAVKNAGKYASQTKASLPQAISSAIQQATSATQQAAENLETMGIGWGFESGTPTGTGLPWQQKMQLATRISTNPKLSEIAKLAGRLKLMAAKKQRSRTTAAKNKIVGVTAGNDLNNILPSELVKLTIPALNPVFFKDYSQRSLLQFQRCGEEQLGRGPIVVCLDSSGSMSGAKEYWSKAVAIALLSIANKQKRTCRILHFCNSVERVDDFPKGHLDPAKLLNCMEYFGNGGTSWEAPLDSALEIIRSEQQYRLADIILIGDDLCGVSSDWLKQFKRSQLEQEFHTYGVLLGNQGTEGMRQILDTVIAIDNLDNDQQIETVFAI